MCSFSDCPCDVEYDYASAGVATGKHDLPTKLAAASMNEERNFSSRLLMVEDLDDLYDTAPCGYLSVLPDGSIGRVNATLLGWTGHRQNAMLGRHLSDFLSAAGRASYESQIVPSLRDSGRLIETTLELLMADGRSLPVLAMAVVRNDTLGNALFTRFMFFPLNERRRFQQGLIEARAALKLTIKRLESEAVELQNRISDEKRQRRAAEGVLYEEREDAELREQFVAVLGHDLRNPLAAIRGGLRILGKDAVGSQANVLALMEGSVAHMAGLIDDVMDFARGRLGGGIGIERHKGQDLTPIIAQVVDELRSAQPTGVIEADISITDLVACDPFRIGQMVSNLLANALTHGSKDDPVRVRATTQDGTLEISVSNQGAIIPPSVLARLFQPFVRGDGSDDRRGLGLGLHIASEVAKAHGGTLSVNSDPTETRFTFRMPVHVED